jgi:hypothetical protein
MYWKNELYQNPFTFFTLKMVTAVGVMTLELHHTAESQMLKLHFCSCLQKLL